MEVLNRVVAYVAVVMVGVGIAWSVALATRPAMDRGLFDRYGVVVIGLLVLAAAIVLIPLVRSTFSGTSRRPGWAIAAGYLALGGVLFRLFTTG